MNPSFPSSKGDRHLFHFTMEPIAKVFFCGSTSSPRTEKVNDFNLSPFTLSLSKGKLRTFAITSMDNYFLLLFNSSLNVSCPGSSCLSLYQSSSYFSKNVSGLLLHSEGASTTESHFNTASISSSEKPNCLKIRST